ncbi:hypothetical protein GCM10025770_23860 [Viridibacterium curvum]|uniref:Uncharacterized protein n=1 Tax=Viridibacterium curvum TaxID=1101404 RepID=A0ABP9QRX2_9RHOO
MATKYVIEDQVHAEWQSTHDSLSSAQSELRRISTIPWGEAPNRCPCQSWGTCERAYEIIEYKTDEEPWTEMQRFAGFDISASKLVWSADESKTASAGE